MKKTTSIIIIVLVAMAVVAFALWQSGVFSKGKKENSGTVDPTQSETGSLQDDGSEEQSEASDDLQTPNKVSLRRLSADSFKPIALSTSVVNINKKKR